MSQIPKPNLYTITTCNKINIRQVMPVMHHSCTGFHTYNMASFKINGAKVKSVQLQPWTCLVMYTITLMNVQSICNNDIKMKFVVLEHKFMPATLPVKHTFKNMLWI